MAARRTKDEIAEKLHAAAIRLLRRLRRVDAGHGAFAARRVGLVGNRFRRSYDAR